MRASSDGGIGQKPLIPSKAGDSAPLGPGMSSRVDVEEAVPSGASPHLPESYSVFLGARCQLLGWSTFQAEGPVGRTVAGLCSEAQG